MENRKSPALPRLAYLCLSADFAGRVAGHCMQSCSDEFSAKRFILSDALMSESHFSLTYTKKKKDKVEQLSIKPCLCFLKAL